MTAVVAHPQQVVLEGLAAALRTRLGLSDVVMTTTGDECAELARTLRPRVAIVDIDVAPAGVLGLCETLRAYRVPTVVVTRAGAVEPFALLEAGAQGFVPATDGLDSLLIAVRTVLDGHAYVPTHLLGQVLQGLIMQRRSVAAAADRVGRLSPRELEVLGLLGAGADHHEIATRLLISPHTAKTHIQRLLGKLEVRSRVEAAALAAAHGVRAPEPEALP